MNRAVQNSGGQYLGGGQPVQKAWVPAEIAILRKYYPTGGTAACLPHLPDRSKLAIYAKVDKLKLCCLQQGPRVPWDDAEIAILRAHYAYGGAKACAPLLPHRSYGAIKNKAFFVGVTRGILA